MSEDFSRLRVVDLKKLLREAGLPVSGRKLELIKRLKQANIKPRKGKRQRLSKSLSPVRCTKGRGKRVYYFDPNTGKRISKAEAERRGIEKCVTVSQRRQERKKSPKPVAKHVDKPIAKHVDKPIAKPPTRLPEYKVEEIVPSSVSLTESILVPSQEMIPEKVGISTPSIVSSKFIETSSTAIENMDPELFSSLSTTEMDVFETAKSLNESVGDMPNRYAIVTAYNDPVFRVIVPKELKGEETIISEEDLKNLYEKYGIEPALTHEMLLLVPPSKLDEVLSLGDKFRNPPFEDVVSIVEEIKEKLPRMATKVTVYEVVSAYRDPIFDIFVPLKKLGREFLDNFNEIDDLYEKYGINPLKDNKYLLLVPPTRLLDLFDLTKEFLEPLDEDPSHGAEALRDIIPKVTVLVTPRYAVLSLIGNLSRKELIPHRFLGEEFLLTKREMEDLYEKYGVGPNETGEYIMVTFPNYADNFLELGKLYSDPTEDQQSILYEINYLIDRVAEVIPPPGMTLYFILTAVKDDRWGIYIPTEIIDARPLHELQELGIEEGKAYDFYNVNPEMESLFLVSEKDGEELMKFARLFLSADTDSQREELIDQYELILPTSPILSQVELSAEKTKRIKELRRKEQEIKSGEYEVFSAYHDDVYGVPVPEMKLGKIKGEDIFTTNYIEKYNLDPESWILLIRPTSFDLLAMGEDFKSGNSDEKEEIAQKIADATKNGEIIVLSP